MHVFYLMFLMDMFFSYEMDRLIIKGMSDIFHWNKLTFSKLSEKVNFLERKFEETFIWRGKRYKLYLGKHLYWHYCLQLSFDCKNVSQISFNLFCSVDLKSKKVARYIRETFYFGIIVFSCLLSPKPCPKFVLLRR